MRDNGNHAHSVLSCGYVQRLHSPFGRRAGHDDCMSHIRQDVLGRLRGPTRYLKYPVPSNHWLADALLVHTLPPTSANARKTVRLRSSTLKAFWVRGCAPSPARAAALSPAGLPTRWPTSAFSTSRSRHGTVPTPPAATRAARMTPPSTCSATAAETRANSYEARSRTLR